MVNKTLQEREKELQALLTTPAGREALRQLDSHYHAASGKVRPARTSVINQRTVRRLREAIVKQNEPMRVLVVEDDERLADVLVRGLADAGHDVSLRRTGPDGLGLTEIRAEDRSTEGTVRAEAGRGFDL